MESKSLFFNHDELINFLFIKVHCFWLGIICYFLATRGQRLPGAVWVPASDGSRSKIFDLGRVGSIFCGSGWVGLGQTYMVWVWIWKMSPKNVKFSIFFPSGQKISLRIGSESTRVEGGSASYLLQVKSKLGSGQGPSLVPTLDPQIPTLVICHGDPFIFHIGVTVRIMNFFLS